MNPPKLIITHRKPDLDAIVSAWLAHRYLFAAKRRHVRFVVALTDKLVEEADCIVDIGKIHNRAKLRFDHKGVECLRHITCSAKLVWRHLRKTGHGVEHLHELVELVHDGDSAKRRSKSLRYRISCHSGLHAKLEELRHLHRDDQANFWQMSRLLNRRFGKVRHSMNRVRGSDFREHFLLGDKILSECAWKPAPGRVKLPSLRKGSPARRAAEKQAADTSRPLETILESVKLAGRIRQIIGVCGQRAEEYLLGGKCRLTQKKVVILSNYAALRMKRVVGRGIRGSPDIVSNPAHWFDTHDFEEVISRLARARGSLTGQAGIWKGSKSLPVTLASAIPELRIVLQFIDGTARSLQKLIGKLPARAEAGETKAPQHHTEGRAADRMRVKAAVNAAAGLIEKNFHDLGSRHFPCHLHPTLAQKQRIRIR